jgi:multimeric flavodoxin WrbA
VILMSEICVITTQNISPILNKMLTVFLGDTKALYINSELNITDLNNKKIIFALELNNIGYCNTVMEILSALYYKGKNALQGSSAVLLVHSSNELYTKSSADHIIFLANNLGCSFIGHPLVEATEAFNNFHTWQKTVNMSLEEICYDHCEKLSHRFMIDTPNKFHEPNILALHASPRSTSNTLMLWNMIKSYITNCSIETLNVANGTIHDCIGCSFTTCIHYSKQNSCFYGGFMIEEIVPAIEKADAIVFISPNYNDALSANLTAVINRTTALYRKISFYNKYLFSIVVSGNSGSDSVAKQLIDALNVNKGFRLTPYSTIMATANNPGDIHNITDIEKLSKLYAENLLRCIKK